MNSAKGWMPSWHRSLKWWRRLLVSLDNCQAPVTPPLVIPMGTIALPPLLLIRRRGKIRENRRRGSGPGPLPLPLLLPQCERKILPIGRTGGLHPPARAPHASADTRSSRSRTKTAALAKGTSVVARPLQGTTPQMSVPGKSPSPSTDVLFSSKKDYSKPGDSGTPRPKSEETRRTHSPRPE